MAKKTTPKLCLHRATGQGYVRLNGRFVYLGPFDDDATRQRFHQVVAEWEAAGRQPVVAPEEITVVELLARFMRHAKQHYRRPDGTKTSEVQTFLDASRHVQALYGRTPAAEFGPKALKAVREKMVAADWARTHVNKQINRVRHVFRWGVAEELVPPLTLAALEAVRGLQEGRCDVRESEPVHGAPAAHIEAVRALVPRQVRAMIDLQLATGARAGELVKLRPIDLDTTGKVWTAKLAQHKTRHHGRDRVVYFGPQAQAVLREFLDGRPVEAPLFSPREANAEQRAARATVRRRPRQKPNPRQTQRRVREQYDTASYRRCIARACEAAGVPVWSPHQLRHSSATALRKRFGLEGAQVMLGHSKVDVTQLYAERNEKAALRIASKVG